MEQTWLSSNRGYPSRTCNRTWV